MSKQLLEIYEQLFTIRRAEELIIEHYAEDEMTTPVHLSIGQEAVAVGVCAALAEEDKVLGTYRSHGIYLARSRDPDAFFGELYGRVSGAARGKAGSMHLAAPDRGLLATSAVVGTTIPLALGTAFAARYRGEPSRVAVFFGDGAIDEGVFWESINYACLSRLPILFICEDNGLAIHSRGESRHGYKSIHSIIERFECQVFSSQSSDALEICNLAREALKAMAESDRPAFLHLETYRYVEHVGPRIDRDFQYAYRQKDEFESWTRRDPVRIMRQRAIRAGIDDNELRRLEARVETRLQQSIERARIADFPPLTEMAADVLA